MRTAFMRNVAAVLTGLTMLCMGVALAGVSLAPKNIEVALANELSAQATAIEHSDWEIIDCTLGQETIGNGKSGWGHTYYRFSLTERSHVYVNLVANLIDYRLSIIDDSDNVVSRDTVTKKTSNNSLNSQYLFDHSCDLDAGVYLLDLCGGVNDYTHTLLISAEPVVSLERTSIKTLAAASPCEFAVEVDAVEDALSYEYAYSTSSDFSDGTTVDHPSARFTATGLTGDRYYYVRVRPFTVYNDGIRVFGNWSRAKAIYVQGLTNKVAIYSKKATLKYKVLKKKAQSFQIDADDDIGADLTYSRSSISAAAKKYLSVNKNTGVVTVRKGLRKGTYKLGVKVKAAAMGQYSAAEATSKITVKVV